MSGQGWECPKCGNVYAPWVFRCQVCSSGALVTGGTTDCDHQWVTNTGGTFCEKCGQRAGNDTPAWTTSAHP